MSTTIKLDVFTLKIKEKGNKKGYLPLNDIAGFNLLDELFSYIGKNIYLFKINNKLEKTTRIDKNELIDNALFCRIKVGKFGESSEIVDTLSGSGIFHKESVHSDTIPLFFHIYADPESDSAVIHVQRVNNRTLLTEIREIINAVLKSLREDQFSFELKPLKESITISNFLNDDKGSISCVNIELKSNLDIENLEPTLIKLRVKSRKEFPTTLKKKIIKATESKDFNPLVSLLPTGFSKHDIKNAFIEVKTLDNRKIKVNIADKINLSNSYISQISRDDLDKYGHPSFIKLKDISSNYMK